MPSKTVLVTGAAGFIGSHLAERCLHLGWRVIAIDAFTEYYEEARKRANVRDAASHPDCSLLEGDLCELDLKSIMEDVSIVFHLAAQAGVRASWDAFDLYTRRNIEATQRLLEAARDASIEAFVLASSSSVYGDAETMPTTEELGPRPVSPYGVTKVAAEHLAQIYWRTFGVPTVGLRYFTVYGPRQRPDMAFNRLIRCALTGDTFEVFGDGAQTRDFTFVTDAVSATVAASQCGVPGSVYNIGGGSRRSMNSVFESLEELLGRAVLREYRDTQAGDARNTSADISRARAQLGYKPTVDFHSGLAAQLEWQQGAMASAQSALAP